MVREKDLDSAALAELAKEIVAIGHRYSATVLVNGDAAAARAAGAAGVHLPQGHSVAAARDALGPGALIGVSAHSRAEAEDAAGAGADYLTLSPVFPTESKPGYGPALGLEAFGRIVRALDMPVLALGGVTAKNAAACLAAGAAGVAVMGTVMRANDPRAAVAELCRSLERAPDRPVGTKT